ncbi:hypothetical protein RA280_43375 [Cupriavidus sp. CV2]|uniref:hypothetical protein n=1 Tax=Cupriavidus ulmosensis TaxID=3065913 RepID=UPI00296AB94C|nr:hypothetical protein [Cupriavidus sp. CV2]MDW3688452.1 hypothetical protein [Cupriavidus sp. CV2]
MRQSIKKQDNVFLLTLVDFLIQVIFFGMFAYAAYAAMQDPRVEQLGRMVKSRFEDATDDEVGQALDKATKLNSKELERALKAEEELQRLQKQMGVSNIAELTDILTKMAPVKELKETSAVIKKAGGIERLNAAVEYYNLRGPGKPHCLTQPGSTSAQPLATLIGYEDHIEIQGLTPQLSTVLEKLGVSFEDVRSLPLREFARTFSKLGSAFPECSYTFLLLEKTRFVEPRDAANALGSVRVRPRRG